MMNEEKKHCLACGEAIEYGRKDKVFCNDKCKNHYHNAGTNSVKNLKLRTSNAIERNYSILQSLLKSGILSIHKSDLEAMGYKVNMLTFCKKGKSGLDCMCYDIKFSMHENKISGIEKINTEILLAGIV